MLFQAFNILQYLDVFRLIQLPVCASILGIASWFLKEEKDNKMQSWVIGCYSHALAQKYPHVLRMNVIHNVASRHIPHMGQWGIYKYKHITF